MKNSISIIALLFCFLTGSAQCGTWRWAVKTITDGTDKTLLSSTPEKTDITTLTKTGSAPHKLSTQRASDEVLPRQSDENRQVTIDCYIYKVKTNEKDRDYHLLLSSNVDCSGDHMDGEIPDPNCPNLAGFSFLKAKYTAARKVALDIKTQTDAGTVVHVQITGVPFWDALHGASGGAPNGREIHPILYLKKL